MSLAEASEARKARLIALRKRKAGEADTEECVTSAGYDSKITLLTRSLWLIVQENLS